MSRLPDQSTDQPLWENAGRADESIGNKPNKIINIIDILPGDIVVVWKNIEAKIVNSQNWFMAEVEITSIPERGDSESSNLKVTDIETGVSHWVNRKLAQKVFINQLSTAMQWCAN